MCGEAVTGNGYTNHCPACLWSLHVDVHPGDRAAICRAPMRPVQLLYERGAFVVVHECTGCGVRRRNKASPDDDVSQLLG
jgi:RNHCP domain